MAEQKARNISHIPEEFSHKYTSPATL